MPPEGYNTVTLPYDLIETIDGLTDMSRAATIRMLVAEHRTDDGGDGDCSVAEVRDLQDRLDRIESAAREATNAAQSAERAVGELQR